MMAVGSLVPLVGMPVYQMFKFVRTPGRMRKVKVIRALSFAAVALAIVAGILLIPTPFRIQGSLVLKTTKPQEMYVEVPGRLVGLFVRDGDQVKKGDVIATLSNPEKLIERNTLQEQHDVSSLRRPSGSGTIPTERAGPRSRCRSRWRTTLIA